MDDIARAALAQYDIATEDAELIRHNENRTYRVKGEREEYVLRVRSPREGFSLRVFGAPKSAQEAVTGETALLSHLCKRAPFPVQRPVKARDGRLYCVLQDGACASLLAWLPGEAINKDEKGQYAAALGEMAAKLHEALSGFDGRGRLDYSPALTVRMEAEIESAVQAKHIDPAHGFVCREALTKIREVMTRLDKTSGARCLIHADLGLGNVLLTPSGLAPIDFSLSGYGYRAQECGMLSSNYQDSASCERLRLAYERASGAEIRPYDQNAFLALSVLLFIACQHERFHGDDWFPGAMERWCGSCLSVNNW